MSERKRERRAAEWHEDEEDVREIERIKSTFSPDAQERNEEFVKALGEFCEQEHPAIAMNGLAAALVGYFVHYYPMAPLEEFLGLMARGYRTEIRRRELQ